MSTGFYATRVDACQSSPPSVHLTNATDARLAGGRRLFVVLPVAIFSALAVVLGWGLTQEARVIPSALIGRPVPDFALPPVEGRNPGLSSADLKGKVSLVNVFASWCMACRLEHPVFMELNRTGLVQGDEALMRRFEYLSKNGNSSCSRQFYGGLAKQLIAEISDLSDGCGGSGDHFHL